jgi:hypothetical protein
MFDPILDAMEGELEKISAYRPPTFGAHNPFANLELASGSNYLRDKSRGGGSRRAAPHLAEPGKSGKLEIPDADLSRKGKLFGIEGTKRLPGFKADKVYKMIGSEKPGMKMLGRAMRRYIR